MKYVNLVYRFNFGILQIAISEIVEEFVCEYSIGIVQRGIYDG